MVDPSLVTLGEASSFVRDFSLIGLAVTLVWKARGVFEKVTQFFDRTSRHMDTMENFAKVVVGNHLTHIEHDLRTIAGRDADDDVIEVTDSLGSN